MRFHYTVSCAAPQTKTFAVALTIHDNSHSELRLKFPVWIPGSYKIRDYAKELSNFSVRSSQGRALAWQKCSKSEWVIETRGARQIEVSYTIYGGDISVHGAYLDHRYGFWNGSALFFYADKVMNAPVEVTIVVPSGWTIATGLKKIDGHRYRAADIDELYDSPVQTSPDQKIVSFTAGGKPHRVALMGDTLKASEEIVKDIKRIVETEIRLMGKAPYDAYTFLIHFVPGFYGGLEHRNSSMNLFDGWLLTDPERYAEFLALIAHEFFHTWNVKRIRPHALGPFDYSQEVYTRELWIAEGMTSYYDDHVLVRAGLMSREDYLAKVITKNIEKYENMPAKSVMSIAESSFDAWIKLYQPTENSVNTLMSYYLKGGLVFMLLDMEIIRRTNGHKTLDDVLRALWKDYLAHPERGFTRDEFDRHVIETSGALELKRFLRDYVDGVKPIVWQRFFASFGWQIVPKKEKKNGVPIATLGVQLIERNGGLYIDKVFAGSAAYRSDLQPGDELIAIDRYRFSKEKSYKDFMTAQKPGSSHEVTYARRSRIAQAPVTLEKNPNFNSEVKLAEKLTASQKRLLDRFFRK